MQKMYGLLLVCVALVIYTTAISIGIAWFAFCFGTFLIGVILLLFAPLLLITPPMFVFSLGHAPMAYGMKLLVNSKQELWEGQLESLNKKIMEFDQERLDYYMTKFYHIHENRALFPEEWKECQSYNKAFFNTVFKRDKLYQKLNKNTPFISTAHGGGRNSKEL